MIHHASKILVSYEASGTSSRGESGYEGSRGQRTEHTGNPTKDRETDVDQKIGIASSPEKDGEGRKEDGEEVEADFGLEGFVSYASARV
jgi:hypothetical protein